MLTWLASVVAAAVVLHYRLQQQLLATMQSQEQEDGALEGW